MRAGHVAVVGTGSENFVKGSDLSGHADGKAGTVFSQVRLDGGNATAMYVIACAGPRFYFARGGANVFQILCESAVPATVLDLRSVNTYTAGKSWITVLASWNAATLTSHLYINDAADKNEVSIANADIDYTVSNWSLMSIPNGAGKLIGAFSPLWFNTTYMDITVEANRRKFYNALLKPAPLGYNGELPLGSAPLVYVKDKSGKNYGTGGDITGTINGTPYHCVGPGGISPNHKVRR